MHTDIYTDMCVSVSVPVCVSVSSDEYIPIYSIYRLEADMGTERKEACVQCALLYTAADGTRHRYIPIYTVIRRYTPIYTLYVCVVCTPLHRR